MVKTPNFVLFVSFVVKTSSSKPGERCIDADHKYLELTPRASSLTPHAFPLLRQYLLDPLDNLRRLIDNIFGDLGEVLAANRCDIEFLLLRLFEQRRVGHRFHETVTQQLSSIRRRRWMGHHGTAQFAGTEHDHWRRAGSIPGFYIRSSGR